MGDLIFMKTDLIHGIKAVIMLVSVVVAVIIDIWGGHAVVKNWKTIWKPESEYIYQVLTIWWIMINVSVVFCLILWAWI